MFPGLIYRMVKPKVVLLIFVSGKIVLTGARVRSESVCIRSVYAYGVTRVSQFREEIYQAFVRLTSRLH